MSKAKIINLKPKGRYHDGKPIYDFHVPFSSGKITTLDLSFASPESAYDHGKDYVANYERKNFPGGMGCVIGVVEEGENTDFKYRAVVNTYYSNS